MPSPVDMFSRIKGMPPKKIVGLFCAAVLSIAMVVLAVTWSQREDYQVLFSNLSEADAGQVVQKLKDLKVPYRVEAGGVQVPSGSVYDTRLQLAAQGLPQGGGVGFELFDKTTFGTTEFVQKLNYKRALQGELARTVMALGEVEQCRVHLAIPEKKLFVREGGTERPSASVLVKLRTGRSLSPAQVDGIIHLVGSSVEGLTPQDVTVVDNKGTVLTKGSADPSGLSTAQFDHQSGFARELEAKIVGILEPVAGRGKVRAKVTAALDFSRNETTEEKYDPEGQVVRSEQKSTEKSGAGGSGGVPGVASNLPGRTAAAAALAQAQSDRQSQTVNYEITKVTTRTVNSPGSIKRLSAAVLVDGTYVAQQGSKELKYTARSEDEIRRYEELVREAIGYTKERGDEVRIVNMPFEIAKEEQMPEEKKSYVAVVAPAARYAAPLVALSLFFLFVVRPLIRSISATPPAPAPGSAQLPYPQVVPGLERGMTPRELPVREQVVEWARKNPQDAAGVIKSWVR